MRDGGIREIWNTYLKGWHLQHVETGGTGRGIPDTNYCEAAHEGWIENKRGEGRYADIIKLRPEQIGWIERRHRAGGRVFVAVRRQLPMVDELWLLGPEHVRLKRLTKEMRPLVLSAGGPAMWDWGTIKSILTNSNTI